MPFHDNTPGWERDPKPLPEGRDELAQYFAEYHGYSGSQAKWFADHLRGDTEDELRADAHDLAGRLKQRPPAQQAPEPDKSPESAFRDYFRTSIDQGAKIDPASIFKLNNEGAN